MHALLHTVGVVAIVPYVALALLFLSIGEAARAQGLWALLDAVVSHAGGFVRWGLYAAVLLWIGLWAMGLVPRLQRTGSLALCALALGSLAVLVSLHSTRLGLGQVVFLLPCAAIAAGSVWLFLRAGAGPLH